MGAGMTLGVNTALTGAQLANSAYQTSQNRKVSKAELAFQQQQFLEKAQSDRATLGRSLQADAYRKALMGVLASNVTDVGYSREGGFAGGLRPSALGMQGREAGGLLASQALASLAKPETARFSRLQANPGGGGGAPVPGKGSSAASGALQGAGIGTMVMPGVGTAIGAGLGALQGWWSARSAQKAAKAAAAAGGTGTDSVYQGGL